MTYGGPHAPTISDTWGGGRLADEAKAHMGYVVFRCDPRSASGKGACSTWSAYRQLGVQELKDIETAITWLKAQSFVDGARIGMSGHSYGGFMTAYAMTHSKLFAAGIASAPVTDWRNYDSIYTERYMNTPQENPGGYRDTSVVAAARNLHGKLLILHGLVDDNVHVQNTVQLVDALQRANKEFDLMLYPRARHGLLGRHHMQLVYDFMGRHLQPQGYNEWKAKRASEPPTDDFRRKGRRRGRTTR
jgi:dipeptidyl aminopeptidase/acylaminoacyl peptidase